MRTTKTSGFFRSKKAFADFLLIAIVLFALAITVIVCYKVVKVFNNNIQNIATIPNEDKQIISTLRNNYVTIWDGLFLFFFILVFLVLLISASLLDAHPAFFIVMLIVTIVTAFVGMHLANTYAYFVQNPSIAEEAAEFTIVPFFFKNYPTVLAIMGITTAIVLYFRPREI